jgi:hypothetical protein
VLLEHTKRGKQLDAAKANRFITHLFILNNEKIVENV